MPDNENIKRIGLYFNLEDEEEKLMFTYISKRKKSRYIKNLILNDIKENNLREPILKKKEDTLNDCNLDMPEIDLDD